MSPARDPAPAPVTGPTTGSTGVAFPFGGRLSLDLTWTLRYRAVWPTELLVEPDDLRRWLDAAGLPASGQPTGDDLARAITLREAIYRAATAIVDGHPVAAADRAVINDAAAPAPPVPVLGADGTRRLVAPVDGPFRASLSVVARDAIELFATAEGRVRRCAGPHCSLLFHDSSRPGRRRWCDTARCGNQVNTRAYRQRRRDSDSG